MSPGLPTLYISLEGSSYPCHLLAIYLGATASTSLCIVTRTKASVHTVQEDVDPGQRWEDQGNDVQVTLGRGGEDQGSDVQVTLVSHRPWAPWLMLRTPALCYQRRKTFCWTALPWRSRTVSQTRPSWLAPRGGDLRQVCGVEI